jgi:hypothetical protein
MIDNIVVHGEPSPYRLKLVYKRLADLYKQEMKAEGEKSLYNNGKNRS